MKHCQSFGEILSDNKMTSMDLPEIFREIAAYHGLSAGGRNKARAQDLLLAHLAPPQRGTPAVAGWRSLVVCERFRVAQTDNFLGSGAPTHR